MRSGVGGEMVKAIGVGDAVDRWKGDTELKISNFSCFIRKIYLPYFYSRKYLP